MQKDIQENKTGIYVNDLSWQPDAKQPEILHHLSFALKPGHFYGILGPNGSGKTSLLRHLLRLLESKKTVLLNGNPLEKWKQKALAQQLSYVPQNTAIEVDFSAEDIVMMGRTPCLGRFEQPSQKDRELVHEAMRMTNCEALAEKSIARLSGGEVQRVVTARAIAQGAEWIFLDEPIAHLDLKHQLELMEILLKLTKEGRASVVSVLHDVNLALQFCDYLLLMKEGQLFSAGEASQAASTVNLEQVYDMRFEELKQADGSRFLVPGLR